MKPQNACKHCGKIFEVSRSRKKYCSYKCATARYKTNFPEITHIDGEVWKSVVGYVGFYEVSNLGRIRSVFRITKVAHLGNPCNIINKQYKCRLIVPQKAKTGYRTVRLCANNIGCTYTVHRLVAIAFIPNPENLGDVNHLDSNRTNNNLDNLEWCSRKENMQHATKKGRMGKLSKEQVLNIRQRCKETPKKYKSIAEEFGIDASTVRSIDIGTTWSHVHLLPH